ncbi:MAG: hypothetical protein ACTHU0_09885 [Kofleriaceae bacterium]
MADLYYIRIGLVDGTRVVLHCLTGFTNDGRNYETSRSFALMVLLDAKLHCDDHQYLCQGAPELTSRRLAMIAGRARSAPSPLHESLPDPVPWDEAWHRAHVPRIIRATRLLARHNVAFDAQTQEAAFAAEERGMWHLLEAAWRDLHHFDLEVELTEASYGSHLVEGHLFGTTAFDAWSET